MALDPTLKKFNIQDFEPIHQEMIALKKEINAYQAQKEKTSNLAIVFFATFVLFTLKLAWNKLSGTDFIVAASSSSSLILCLFDIALGGITLMFRMIEKTKAQRFAERINAVVQKTTRNFYGECTEQRPDSDTPAVVLESMQANLKPHFKELVPIKTDYSLIVTHEFTVEGDSADNFDWSSKKITDNLEEVKAAIGRWRKHYYDRYIGDLNSTNSAIMQVLASQCIQGLSIFTIIKEPWLYECHPAAILTPQSGYIILKSQNPKTDKEPVVKILSPVCLVSH